METLNRLQPYLLSVLRIIVGLLFMQHGLSKLFGFPAGICLCNTACQSCSGSRLAQAFPPSCRYLGLRVESS
jgi:uncharacterized membrane protein YphA (DoxX/SURF4 family)